MEDAEINVVQLELKYCERCGGLWIRPRGSEIAFCRGCSAEMVGFVGGFHHTASESVTDRKVTSPQPTFWSEGGNA